VIGCSRARLPGAKAVLLAVSFGTLSPAAFAQDKLDREIVFVRALARDMKFIELAKEEADRLAADHRGAADQDRIAQLGIEVSYHGARSKNDRNVQRTLFKEALDRSKELIDRSSDAAVQMAARTTLADAAQDFGQFLIEELEMARGEAPERVKELEDEAAAVFKAGIDATKKLREDLQSQVNSDPQKQTQFWVMGLRLGVLLREQGRAVKTERETLISRSISELEEMVLEAGEETALGLRGLFEIAQAREVGGDIVAAIDSYKTTIDQISTALQEAQEDKIDLPPQMQVLLFTMLQEVTLRATEVMVRQGASDTGAAFAKFREHMKTFGDKDSDLFDIVDPRWGHLVLLAECRFEAESGDAKRLGAALAMAQRINDKHPNDYVGVRAKAVLGDILVAQSSLVSGKLLFEIAKGEFQNKNYEAAVKGLRRAVGAMSPEEQQALGLESYQMLGESYGRGERYLEAILALREGLQRFGAGDKERASDAADTLDRAIGQLKRITKNDPFFDTVYADASGMVANYSVTGGSKLFWKGGNDQFLAKKYAEAITEYQKIQPDFVYYEVAQVRIARAHQASGDFANARKAIEAYRAWAQANPIEARETAKTQARSLAMADAEFLDAQMAYLEARGNDEQKLPRQLPKYPEALHKLRGFVANFAKDAEGNLPVALEYIGRLHADLGEMDKAEEAYAQLKEKDAPRASRLATEVFSEYQSQIKQLTTEIDNAIAKDKPDAEINPVKTSLNSVRQKLTAIGLDYIANAPKPQLAVLVNTMLAFEELKDWKKVDEVAQKTLSLYATDPNEATRKVLDLTVRPRVGEAMLQQQKFQQAYDMLVEAEKANPTQWELKRQIARALGGWFEFSNTGASVRVAGLDRPAEAYTKYYQDYRPWALRPEVKPYSLEWYRFHWECYWFAKQAGIKDGKFKDIADKFYRIAKATNDFATLKSHGVAGQDLFKFFQINR
jgi:tetratricopeptide (TPR) repeat protein